MTKPELRKKHKNIRNNINYIDINVKSERIKNNFINYILKFNLKTVLIYKSFGSEVITDEIISCLIKSGIRILIPKCDIDKEKMIACEYNQNTKCLKNFYGIDEPENIIQYNGAIDLIVVPGIAFDRYGNRIGYGKGYYDKFISEIKDYKPKLIALCFDEQIIHESIIPTTENDIPMDVIITDKETLELKTQRE